MLGSNKMLTLHIYLVTSVCVFKMLGSNNGNRKKNVCSRITFKG